MRVRERKAKAQQWMLTYGWMLNRIRTEFAIGLEEILRGGSENGLINKQ